MIFYVENKTPNTKRVNSFLDMSKDANHWANSGPVVKELEKFIHAQLKLGTSHRVLACSSGTAALFAAGALCNSLFSHMSWTASTFTFPCQQQGPFAKTCFADVDNYGHLCFNKTVDFPSGLLVTNLFGGSTDPARYERWQHGSIEDRVVIYDSASSYGTTYRDVSIACYGTAHAFSFHHTKPMGFGEGGCLVVHKDWEPMIRDIINFGGNNESLRNCSFNGKMSDVSAAYILDRLHNFIEIKATYIEQYNRILDIVARTGLNSIPFLESVSPVPSCVPILLNKPVSLTQLNNPYVILRKYYKPLVSKPMADNIYSRIVCFPCHTDLNQLSDKEIESVCNELYRLQS